MEIMVKYAAILPPQCTVLLKHIPRVWCRTVFRRNNGFTGRHSTQRLENGERGEAVHGLLLSWKDTLD